MTTCVRVNSVLISMLGNYTKPLLTQFISGFFVSKTSDIAPFPLGAFYLRKAKLTQMYLLNFTHVVNGVAAK